MIVRIPTPAEGNTNYPLPPDYHRPDATAEYRRCARVNASRQYRLPYNTDAEASAARIESLRFFDYYYLWPDEDNDFNPLFYDDEPRITPDFHWAIISNIAVDRFTASIAPRGGAKSTLCFKDILHVSTTWPGYSYVYCTSTNDNAKTGGSKMKDTLYNNERIHDDFGPEPEFGGKIKPHRGDLPTGVENFALSNRSWVSTTSVESRQRGKRPRRYRLDDPEYDPAASTSVSVLREGLEWRLHHVIIPMIFRPGIDVGVDWIGTYVSKRHLLYAATTMVRHSDGTEVAQDSRFNNWTRTVIDAILTDPETGREVSAWPDMWPLTIADKKKDPRLKHAFSLEEMPEVMGSSVFLSEMRGRPGDTDRSGFVAIDEDRHGYSFTEVDDALVDDPRSSSTVLTWRRPAREEPGSLDTISMPISEFLMRARLFMTLDTAKTNTATSDWKVCTVMAHLPEPNELFVLDMHATKARQSKFIEAAFRMADRWTVRHLYPEVVKDSYALYHEMRSISQTRATEFMGVKNVPHVIPLKPGMLAKEAKIETLGIRFEHALIKLPFWLRYTAPWNELFLQIDEFSPEIRDGGLQKDDHIDTVAMSSMIVKSRSGMVTYLEPEAPPDPDAPVDIEQAIEDGIQTIGGLPLLQGVDPLNLSRKSIHTLVERYHDSERTDDTESVI